MSRPTPKEVSDALERLTRVEGVLYCTLKVIDGNVDNGGDDWHISESLHGALKLLSGCYATLDAAIAEEGEVEPT